MYESKLYYKKQDVCFAWQYIHNDGKMWLKVCVGKIWQKR